MSLGKFLSGSKSASSAKLLEVRIKEVRFGNEFASVGCMLLILFRASRSVRNRGERGKLERAVMSLSVKSMASWSYSDCSATDVSVQFRTWQGKRKGKSKMKGGREGKRRGRDELSQRPNSQSRVSCVL